MMDAKKLNSLRLDEQLELIRVMADVARSTYAKAKNETPEVRETVEEFLKFAEEQLEKASWALR